jgi:hypothetical protein
MKLLQKERILNLISNIRKTTFYSSADAPERARIGLYVLQGQLDQLKVYVQRIEDDYIKSFFSQLNTDFNFSDQESAIRTLNKITPIFEEIEDYLLQDDYESIFSLSQDSSSTLQKDKHTPQSQEIELNSEELEAVRREIAKGALEKAIQLLTSMAIENDIYSDNLLSLESRLNFLRSEYAKGKISFEDYSPKHASLIFSIITEYNELKRIGK